MNPLPFRDRREAGRVLAAKLAPHANRPDTLVLALPRGGVPVAYEVAHALGAPPDVFLARKLGVPGYEELAMGAVATGGVRVMNDEIVNALRFYRPDTERQSHYFHARVPDQFDAVLHFDETRAVEPLERTAEWEAGEVPETFPFGV